MILLNLTLPPLLYIYLGPAILSNISLPAQPMSPIAAFWDNNTPIPCWVLQDRLYVLQDGAPSYVMYVPRFENNSGTYVLSINASGGAVVIIPPGVVAGLSSRYTLLGINRTGIYVYINASNVTISFSPAVLAVQNSEMTTQQISRKNDVLVIAFLASAAAVLLSALIVIFARRRKSYCGDLGDTDRLILRKLKEKGGSIARSELARELKLPASTLHKHLHKLARYGYIKLVIENGVQRVELLRECSDG